MTEFAKLKIGFALALLGTLFALHPILDRYAEWGYDYLGYRLTVFEAFALTSVLLGLSVYCYAVALMSDRPHSRFERTGNYVYSLAVLVLPIYAGFYLSARLAEHVRVPHVSWGAPAVAAGLGAGWLLLSQVLAWHIRGRLGEQDRLAKLAQLARQEVESLDHARELFAAEHYDLSVIESWRALEARLRQALLSRRIVTRAETPDAILHAVTRRGIVREPITTVVGSLRRSWTHAMSADPLPREAAVEALSAVRHIFSVIPARPHAGDGAVGGIQPSAAAPKVFQHQPLPLG